MWCVDVLEACGGVGGVRKVGGEVVACVHKGEMREGERKRDACVEERCSLWWRGREAWEETLGRGGGRSKVGRVALSVLERERGANEKKNE